jgi:hypothetical protein
MSKGPPIKPPAKDHPDDRARAPLEAALSIIPGMSGVLKLIGEWFPTQAQKSRGKWEGAVTARTNEHAERLDGHDQTLNPTNTLTGVAVQLVVALARAPGTGMAGRGLTLDDLCKFLPEADPKAVDEAAFELNALGLVDIQRAIGKQWWLRLNQKFYEQVDHQVMGWESTTEDDARTLAGLLLEDESRERTAVLHAASGWEKRRFNPAFQLLLRFIPDGRVSREIQPDYPSSSLFLSGEDKALLRRFIAEGR